MKKNIRYFLIAFLLSLAGLAFAVSLEVLKDVPSTYVYPTDGFLPFNIHRGTQTMLSLMVPGCSFDDPKGVACALLKTDHDPKAPQNDVVITCIGVNSGAGEIVYNVGLKELDRFGSPGKGPKQFMAPTGAAINPDGEVAVADTGNNRIALLKHDGMRLTWVKTVGKMGSKPGQFIAPMGVAYDSSNRLYIADTGNNRIQVMDGKGRCHVLKTPELTAPSAVAVIDTNEVWTFYKQGKYADRLAVIDRQGTRLQTFTLEGDPLSVIRAEDMPDQPVKLWGCAFDYYGNVVVTDNLKSCLRKFDKDLRYIATFGSFGDDDFQFNEPRGIAFNHQFGQVIVAEKNTVQYFWNGADAVNLHTERIQAGFKITFSLTERAYVTAEVRTKKGDVVKSLVNAQDMEIGPQTLEWDPDPTVAKADYDLVLRIMATYSTRDRIAKEITLPLSYLN